MTTLTELPWPRRSARLLVRPEVPEDLEITASWDLDPDVNTWLYQAPTELATAVEARRTGLGETLVGEFEGRIVARGKITAEAPRAHHEVREQAAGRQMEIGWTVDPARHGEGFGTEMAQVLLDTARALGARRVTAYYYAEHHASRRIMEKLGMRQEALFRADWLDRDGTWRDTVAYGIVCEDA